MKFPINFSFKIKSYQPKIIKPFECSTKKFSLRRMRQNFVKNVQSSTNCVVQKICAFTLDFNENFHFIKYIQGNIFKQKEILFFIINNYIMEIYFLSLLGTETDVHLRYPFHIILHNFMSSKWFSNRTKMHLKS